MMIVEVNGGIGNQLFQVSFASNLRLKYHRDVSLGISSIQQLRKGVTKRGFEIQPLVGPELEITHRPFRFEHRFALRSNLLRGLCHLYTEADYSKLGFALEKNQKYRARFFGYWQGEEYWGDGLSCTLKTLEVRGRGVPGSFWNTIDPKRVAVHVRRGDYVTNASANIRHGFLGVEYYKEAFQFICSTLNDPTFVVFSDDIAWCRSSLEVLPYNFQFYVPSEDISDLDQLLIMSRFSHHVIANSTYSWWAAVLADYVFDASRLVVAPRNWYSSGSPLNISMYRPGWIIL